jgi:hypothetical protein
MPPVPSLTMRTFLRPIQLSPVPQMRERRRRWRYPQHYHLRQKMIRRASSLITYLPFDPWDTQETKSHMKYKWISDTRASYGAHLDRITRSLCLDGPSFSQADYAATIKVKEKPTEKTLAEIQETRSHNRHRWISDPTDSYGSHFHSFCSSFDPTTPLHLMRGDFVESTTSVRETFFGQLYATLCCQREHHPLIAIPSP